MQYDPPHLRKKRRRDPAAGRSEQGYLSRRMFLAKSGVVAIFAVLAGKLGWMQISQGESYKEIAENNIQFREVIKAPRGLITDRKGRTLAENRRAWEVRVVPSGLPSRTDEPEARKRVLESLAAALGLENVLVIEPNAVPKGSADLVYNRVATMLGTDEADKPGQIQFWREQSLSNDYVKVVDLSIDESAMFRSKLSELPGVSVINEVEYLVENIWSVDRPVTIRTDVPREVALRLEANLLYLPGVTLDDNALVRSYRGGEIMSHVMGYVQTIDNVSLRSPENLDDNKQRIYDQSDFIGREGLEQALESQLRGVKGVQIVERDVNGVDVRVLREGAILPKPGKNARLSIDIELQEAIGKALRKQIDAAAAFKVTDNAKRLADGKKKPDGTPSQWEIPNAGAAVAFDPRTGEILGMVSYPYYDNQLFVTGISQTKFAEYLEVERGTPFLNRCTNELYPPGSTFKIFLAASALHQGTVKPEDTHVCRGAIYVPYTNNIAQGTPMACWLGWQNSEHSELNLFDAIKRSCDTYFYNVAVSKSQDPEAFEPAYYLDYNMLEQEIVSNEKHVFDGLGIDPMADDMRQRFWFGKPTEIEVVEAQGLFPDREWKAEINPNEDWNVGDTLNISIGQGETKATPLQIALNTASLANGGRLLKPRLIHNFFDQTGEEEQETVELGRLEIAQEHIDVVVEGMRRVVHEEQGTAFTSMVDDVPVSKWLLTNPEDEEEEIIIAGKTGTAEFGEIDELGARDTHAWFTCFAPLENPEIAVSVVIEAGGEGSTFAVPVADEVLRAYFEMTGRRPRGKVLSTDLTTAPGDAPADPDATPDATPDAG